MRDRIWRIAMLNGALLAALAMPAWAGSAQAPLAVSVVVPARCAVRMAGTIVPARVVSRVRIPPEQVFELAKALTQQLEFWEQETGRRPPATPVLGDE